MTAPGFVPRPDLSIVDRLAKLEARMRTMQQATAGATTAGGGVPLGGTPAASIGSVAQAGTALTSARSDHVHTSALVSQGDVALSSPVAGHLLSYNGTQWTNVDKHTAWAKYARRSGDGVQTLASGDQLAAFPTSVHTHPDVVAGGSGNTSWTLAPGTWLIVACARLQTFPVQAAMFLVGGTAADETQAIVANDFANAHGFIAKQVTLTAATTYSLNIWRGGSATALVSFGNDLTHVEFQRQYQ